MTQLSLENATLKEILPVLMRAVKAFTSTYAAALHAFAGDHAYNPLGTKQRSVPSFRK